MAALLTGGRLVSSSTRCSFSSLPSVVKTKMKFTTPFSLMNLCTRFTCLVTRFRSFRSCSPVSLSCVLVRDQQMLRKSCLMLSSGTSTGMTSTTSVCPRRSCLLSATPPIPATSTRNSPVSPRFLRRCNQVSFLQLDSFCRLKLTMCSALPGHAGRIPGLLLHCGLCLILLSPRLKRLFLSCCVYDYVYVKRESWVRLKQMSVF